MTTPDPPERDYEARYGAIRARYEALNASPPRSFLWEDLGVGDDGLAIHLPMGVTVDGRGPCSDHEAHHFICWCGNPACTLTNALQLAHDTALRP